jgi:branched-chain amino acid transport system substrate-binding protein
LRARSDVPHARGALAALLLLACSSSRFENGPCRDDGDCRAAFGFGAVCNRSGFCSDVRPPARCNTSHPTDLQARPSAYRQAIVFGSLMDRGSEPSAIQELAIRLAVKAAGDAGGIVTRPVGLVMCNIGQDAALDGASRAEAAAASAEYLARTLGVPAIVGPAASADTERVWQALRDAGTLVISPAATGLALGTLAPAGSDEQPGLLWRTAPGASLQGQVIADDMLARGVKAAAVIREPGSYGESVVAAFSARFAGGQGVAEVTPLATEAQLPEAVAKVAAGAVDEVLFVSSQPTWILAFLAAAAREPGFTGADASTARTIFLTEAAADPALLAQAAGAAGLFPRVRGTRPAPRDAGDQVYGDFLARYRAEYGGGDASTGAYAANAYDAAWLSVYGAVWAVLREGAGDGAAVPAMPTGLGIARGLRRLSAGTSLPVGPGSLAGVTTAFRAGRTVNLAGASGDLDFHAATRELTGPVEIWTVGSTDGQPTMVRLDTRTPL